ncbi:hypothetical protein OG693_34695 [Streptomyces sp. NBC_01259]
MTDLVECGGAGLDRRAGGVAQGAYPGDRVVLGGAVGSSGQGGAGGGVGVDRVRLADAATFGPVGAVDLDDPVPVRTGGPGEAGSVGGSAFHTDRDHMVVCGQESQGRRVSCGGGGEFGVRETATVVADDSDMDRVGVGIDSAEHMLVRSVLRDPRCHADDAFQPEVGTGRVAQTGH